MDTDSSDDERRRYRNLIAKRQERMASASMKLLAKSASSEVGTNNVAKEARSLVLSTPMELKHLNVTPIVLSLTTPIASARGPSPRNTQGNMRKQPTEDWARKSQSKKDASATISIELPDNISNASVASAKSRQSFGKPDQNKAVHVPKVPPLRLDQVATMSTSVLPDASTRKNHIADNILDKEKRSTSYKQDVNKIQKANIQSFGRKKIRFSDSDDSEEDEIYRATGTSIRLKRALQTQSDSTSKFIQQTYTNKAHRSERDIDTVADAVSLKLQSSASKDDVSDSESDDMAEQFWMKRKKSDIADSPERVSMPSLTSQVSSMALEIDKLRKELSIQIRSFHSFKEEVKAEISSLRNRREAENFDPQRNLISSKSSIR